MTIILWTTVVLLGAALNAELSQQWPVITTRKDPLPDAKEWEGKPGKLPPPVDDITTILTPQQIAGAKGRLLYSAIGGPETVKRQLTDFIALTGVDELMVTGMMFDNAARIRSLEIVAEVRDQMATKQAA